MLWQRGLFNSMKLWAIPHGAIQDGRIIVKISVQNVVGLLEKEMTTHSSVLSWSLPWKLKVEVKVTQSCLTLCDRMDYRVHGILQTRILEWVALPFSRGSSQPGDWTQVSLIAGGSFTTCWATGEAPMDSIKRQNYMTLEDECPRLEGVQCTSGEEWEVIIYSFSKNEVAGPKSENDTKLWMWLVVKVKSDAVKNYCIGTWDVRSMNPGKLEVVK